MTLLSIYNSSSRRVLISTPQTPPWNSAGRGRRVGTQTPLSGLKGVQPPLPVGERTRGCSPGHAGKEGPQLARTGASQGFPRAAAPVGVFSRGTTRISGSLSCGANNMICSPKLPSLSQPQGPTKPPPPRKPLPADPHGRRPSGDLSGPGAGIPPPVVPSR